MITSDKIFKMVENFRKYTGKVKIDMAETSTKDHPCGTVCCHAGAYHVIKRFIGDFIPKVRDEELDMEEITPYGIGRQLMALDLGFSNFREMLRWARDNKDIWGNEYGEHMFSSNDAFIRFGAEVTLKRIINHWEGVGRRLREKEIREGKRPPEGKLRLISIEGNHGEITKEYYEKDAVNE